MTMYDKYRALFEAGKDLAVEPGFGKGEHVNYAGITLYYRRPCSESNGLYTLIRYEISEMCYDLAALWYGYVANIRRFRHGASSLGARDRSLLEGFTDALDALPDNGEGNAALEAVVNDVINAYGAHEFIELALETTPND
jgi:hypothetical protein